MRYYEEKEKPISCPEIGTDLIPINYRPNFQVSWRGERKIDTVVVEMFDKEKRKEKRKKRRIRLVVGVSLAHRRYEKTRLNYDETWEVAGNSNRVGGSSIKRVTAHERKRLYSKLLGEE